MANLIALDGAGTLPPALARSRWRPTPAQRRQLKRESAHFSRVRRAESWYGGQLRKIGRHVGDLVRSFDPNDVGGLNALQEMLSRYASSLEPWARAAAARMITEVSRRDATAWFKTSRELGIGLRDEVTNTPLGEVVRQILEDQVELITSLPRNAAQRVQQHALEVAMGGRRYDELKRAILDTGHVAVNRATLIARTETAKAQSAITQARARYVGADSYIWRTARDADVRTAHKRLEGTVHRWDDPPVAEANGERHHPGEAPNCRCYSEPVLPEIIQ